MYVDADLRSTLRREDLAAYNKLISALPNGASPIDTAIVNTPAFLGAGFVLNAVLSSSTDPKSPCCCKSFNWKQEIVGHVWNSKDYDWPTTSGPAVDFPGQVYYGGIIKWNSDDTTNFLLKLMYVDSKGKKTEIYKIPWSVNTKVDAHQDPSSATVTLTIDW